MDRAMVSGWKAAMGWPKVALATAYERCSPSLKRGEMVPGLRVPGSDSTFMVQCSIFRFDVLRFYVLRFSVQGSMFLSSKCC